MLRMKWTTGAIGGTLAPSVNTARHAFTSPWRGVSGSTTARGTGGGAVVAGWRRRSASCDELSPRSPSRSRSRRRPPPPASSSAPTAAPPPRFLASPPPQGAAPQLPRPQPPRRAIVQHLRAPPLRRKGVLPAIPRSSQRQLRCFPSSPSTSTQQQPQHSAQNTGPAIKKKDRSNSKFLHTNSLIKLKRSPPDLSDRTDESAEQCKQREEE